MNKRLFLIALVSLLNSCSCEVSNKVEKTETKQELIDSPIEIKDTTRMAKPVSHLMAYKTR